MDAMPSLLRATHEQLCALLAPGAMLSGRAQPLARLDRRARPRACAPLRLLRHPMRLWPVARLTPATNAPQHNTPSPNAQAVPQTQLRQPQQGGSNDGVRRSVSGHSPPRRAALHAQHAQHASLTAAAARAASSREARGQWPAALS
jgi:hypothetical protein